jgi:preprotein translocase subunit YajC
VFFYLFLLRPQQKKAKQHQQLLNALKKDDKVIAAGGIFATVVNVKDNNSVEVKIADGVNIIVSKPSITTVFVRQEEEAAKTPDIIKK